MTSFGAKKIKEDGFMPTFKVQGQVYHLVVAAFYVCPIKSLDFFKFTMLVITKEKQVWDAATSLI